MPAHNAIVSYDISKDSTRHRVSKILMHWRLDGQKSVHECQLTESEANELFLQLSEEMDMQTDRLLLAWVDNHRPIAALGKGVGGGSFASMLRV